MGLSRDRWQAGRGHGRRGCNAGATIPRLRQPAAPSTAAATDPRPMHRRRNPAPNSHVSYTGFRRPDSRRIRHRRTFPDRRDPLHDPSLLAAAATVIGLATALPAAAQFQKPEDAVKYRKAAIHVMAAHFGRMGAMANGRAPFDAAAAAGQRRDRGHASTLPFAGFVEGTQGTEKGAPKANVWTDRGQVRRRRQEDAGRRAKLATSPPRPAIWTSSRPPSARPPAPARPATTTSASLDPARGGVTGARPVGTRPPAALRVAT